MCPSGNLLGKNRADKALLALRLDSGSRSLASAAEFPVIAPQCPHCRRPFACWALAKPHVKHCGKGPHPRRTIYNRAE